MEKTNDMMLATVRNPQAKLFDFLDNDVNPENTRLLSKDEYKSKNFIKEAFTDDEGVFNEESFSNAYKLALHNYNQIADEVAIENLDKVKYNPFDITRPVNAGKTWNTDVNFSVDRNPYKQLYSREGVNSVTDSKWSMRELAQKGQIYDTTSGKFLESVNKRSFFDKMFGETLVYAQWDEDGLHEDPVTGRTVKHKKGDWKLDENGDFHLETLGNREVYGKQVVASADILTTDGSMFNKIDVFDSDGKEKSIGKVAARAVIEIAPFFTPAGTVYGGIRAATSLLGVLPTFYKSIESLLRGDSVNYGNDPVTKLEGWMSKFNAESTSDAGSESMWNAEQMANMVTSIFSQIYEQRAMASLSKVLVRPDKLLNQEVQALKIKTALASRAHGVDANKALEMVVKQSPTIQKAYKAQTQLSKSLSLGYMALTSTGSVYGDALEGGYDRRTAGFAALLTAAGQYGVMNATELGTWFLDETTGFEVDVSKGAFRKAAKEVMQEIDDVFTNSKLSTPVKRAKLAEIASKFKKGAANIFNSPALSGGIAQNMLKEGFEEVAEQMVEDASKGIIDVMSHLGLTKQQGSFGVAESYESGEAFQEYLANFVGGLLGGALFELERTTIAPMLAGQKMNPELHKNITELVASGYKDQVIEAIKKEGKLLTNNHLSLHQTDGEFNPAENLSQSDVVVQKTIEVVEYIDALLNQDGTKLTDDEIIHKAVRTQVIIDGLESSKEGDRKVGIEGLVIDDFRKNASKLADIRAQLNELEKSDNNAEQVKLLEEKAKPYVDKIENILSGEYGMHYFDQIALYLNSDIKKLFGSLDRETFIQATYNQSYEDLPNEGVTLTKKKADKEWEDFLDSTDMRSKLEIVTKVYKDLESSMNGSIKEYVDTGYDIVRKETSKLVLDLDDTIARYNTSSDKGDRNKLLNNFINLNKYLATQGLNKVLPYDSFISDISDQILNLGLVKKAVQLEDGSIDYVDFTEAELNEKRGGDLTVKEIIKEELNQAAKSVPADPFSLDLVIGNANASSQYNESHIDEQIASILQSTDTENQGEQIAALQNQKIGYYVTPLTNDALYSSVLSNLSDNIKASLESVAEKYTLEDESLSDEGKLKRAVGVLKEYEDALDFLPKLKDKGKTINLEYLKKQVTLDRDSNGPVVDLNNIELSSLITLLRSMGILRQLDRDVQYRGQEIQSIIANMGDSFIEAVINLQDLLDNSPSDVKFDQNIEEFIETLLALSNDYINNVLSITADPEVKQLFDDMQDQRPEISIPHNYAFELLITALEGGAADMELYNKAKVMYNEQVQNTLHKIFPKLDSVDESLLTAISDESFDAAGMFDLLSRWWSEYSTEYDPMEDSYDIRPSLTAILNANGGISGQLENTSSKEFLLDGDSDIGKVATKLMNLYSGTLTVRDMATEISQGHKRFKESSDFMVNIRRFKDLPKTALKSNPMYDLLRSTSMTMDSNAKSSVNKVLDILEREQNSFRTASTVDTFVADGIRRTDIQQAMNLLEMMETVVSNMSTTSMTDGEISGFIAMRQQYAKNAKLEDDVSQLFTIDSDQASIMNRDLRVIRSQLGFLRDLAAFNSRKISNEEQAIRDQAVVVELDLWKNVLEDPTYAKFIPNNFEDLLNSSESGEKKKIQLETAFYDHNKDMKQEAVSAFTANSENLLAESPKPLSADTRNYSPFIALQYITANLIIRAEDDAVRYLSTLESTIDKAPFYTQELAAKIARAHIMDPELFHTIFNNTTIRNGTDARFWTLLRGAAGTGKTTVITAIILDILRQSNDKSNVWLSGPETRQSKKLHEDIVSAVNDSKLSLTSRTKDELFSSLGEGIKEMRKKINQELNSVNNPQNTYVYVETGLPIIRIPDNFDSLVDYTKLPNLLVVDEGTHYTQPEIMILNEISKRSLTRPNTTHMNLLGLGDINQIGYRITVANRNYGYNINNVVSIAPPPLSLSIRSKNDQKRDNMDMLVGLAGKAEDIFDVESRRQGGPSYERADAALRTYLLSLGNSLSLKHFHKDVFRGELLTNKIAPDVAKTILKGLRDGEVVGVITKDGILSEDIKNNLTEAGYTDEDLARISTFTPTNVQGAEVDYMIYNVDIIDARDNLRDKVKSFYTFSSRSTQGTVILDPNNWTTSTLNITSAPPSPNNQDFDPLQNDVDELKQNRIKTLRSILGDVTTTTNEHNFKWKNSEKIAAPTKSEPTDKKESDKKPEPEIVPEVKEVINPEKADEDPTPEELGIPELGSTKVPETVDDLADNANFEPAKRYDKEEYQVMVHSFYNNANATIRWDGTDIQAIHNNANGTNTDLNGVNNVNDPKKSKKIFDQWANLRIKLFGNTSAKSLTMADYVDYMEHITGSKITNPGSAFNITYHTIATKYIPGNNSPQMKFGNDATRELNQGDPFITLVAKIQYGAKSNEFHYITLAAFPRVDTFKKAIKNYMSMNGEKLSEEQLKLEYDLIDKFHSRVATSLEKNKLVELSTVDPKEINIITSTRLINTNKKGKYDKHKLSEIGNKFPGMLNGGVKVYPSNEDAYVKLVKSFTFNERSDEDIRGTFKQERIDANGQPFMYRQAGKPYIAVTYDGKKETVNGTNGLGNSSRLLSIGADSRNMETLIKEIREIREDLRKEISHFSANNTSGGSFKVSDSINARFDTLLDKNQILDILIRMSGHSHMDPINENSILNQGSLLDILTLEVPLVKTRSFEASDKTTSLLQAMNLDWFGTEEGDTTKKFRMVIDSIKANRAKGLAGAELKKAIIADISDLTGWNWAFYNIFDIENQLHELASKDASDNARTYDIDEDNMVADSVYDELMRYSNEVTDILNTTPDKKTETKFFYSIPLEKDGLGGYKVNSYISGEKEGFQSKYFADKFYITLTPEAPRATLPMKYYSDNMDTVADTVVKENTPPAVKPEAEVITPTRSPMSEASEMSEVIDGVIEVSEMLFNDPANGRGTDVFAKHGGIITELQQTFGEDLSKAMLVNIYNHMLNVDPQDNAKNFRNFLEALMITNQSHEEGLEYLFYYDGYNSIDPSTAVANEDIAKLFLGPNYNTRKSRELRKLIGQIRNDLQVCK